MTNAEIAAALRAALTEYELGTARLWLVVNCLEDCAKSSGIGYEAADHLRLLLLEVAMSASLEDEGHAPGDYVNELLARVRAVADELAA